MLVDPAGGYQAKNVLEHVSQILRRHQIYIKSRVTDSLSIKACALFPRGCKTSIISRAAGFLEQTPKKLVTKLVRGGLENK